MIRSLSPSLNYLAISAQLFQVKPLADRMGSFIAKGIE
jgi:hypothetical protein